MAPHQHQPGSSLRTALLLTIVILLVELGGGLWSHSLALLSDAGHVVTDVVALGLAWFAIEQAKRPADARRTFGYHRVGILAALVNAVTLIVIVGVIGFEAARRFLHPEPVQGLVVVGAAVAGIVLNGYIGLGLRGEGGNLNVRAALLHVLGDLLASVAVVASGIVILLTHWYYADPVISVAIAALIAWGGLRLVMETVNVLLEGTPRGVDMGAVSGEIEGTSGVRSVHDLHVWSLSPEQLALSCHVVVSRRSLSDAEHLVRDIEIRLCERFEIGHTTIQLESEHPCPEEPGHGRGDHNHPHKIPSSRQARESPLPARRGG